MAVAGEVSRDEQHDVVRNRGDDGRAERPVRLTQESHDGSPRDVPTASGRPSPFRSATVIANMACAVG
jgi:hypothetical protein